MTRVADVPPITHEHVHALAQVLGKREARTVYERFGMKHPCLHCGAKVGEPCVTEAGLPTQAYQHKSRRSLSYDEAQRYIYDVTKDIVERRSEGLPATVPTSPPFAIRLGPKPRITVDLNSEPSSIARGFAAAADRLKACREREERAWTEAGEAALDLVDAEREYAEQVERVRSSIADPEAML